jgi:outer membrane protein assembly factor BamB/orotate phosphoribosyltransferase
MLDKTRPDIIRLLEIIKTKSIFVFNKPTPLLLSPSGKPNRWTVDLRRTFLDPEGLNIIVNLFWELFENRLPFQVGGLEMGAIPLITGIQVEGRKRGFNINGFVVRKERKNYGLTKTYEGIITDDPIVLVDDLINSAETLEKARVVVQDAGHKIRNAFVIVDYQTLRGKEWCNHNNIDLSSIYILSELGLKKTQCRANPYASKFQILWRNQATNANYFEIVPKSTPVVDEHNVYFGSDSGDFVSLDQITGAVRWRFPTSNHTRKKIFSSPALLNGCVYFGAYNGNVYCLDTATGKEVWRFTEADWVGSSPAIATDLNLLFIGLEHALAGRRGSFVALDLSSGEKIFEYPVRECLHGSPTYCSERQLVAIGTNDNTLLMFDPKKNKILWKFTSMGPIKYAPTFDISRNTVLFASQDGIIYIVDIDSGDLVWTATTQNILYSTPLIVGDYAYVSSTDKYIYLLDLRKQRIVKSICTFAKNLASPRYIGGKIYCGSTSGALFEFEPKTLEITGLLQFPERITNAITYSKKNNLFFAMTYDTSLWAFYKTINTNPS